MSWSFETDPEFQKLLDWVQEFITEEVEPLDYLPFHPYDIADPLRAELVPPLQQKVKDKGLWACHLGPNLGGPGYGQVKLALLNEIIGQTRNGPIVFGTQAPDSGNAEILAHYGSPALKEQFLQPLLNGEITSTFSMTEPQGGSDPTRFIVQAQLDGDEWVINGEKWFSSLGRYSSFFIVMAVTEPDADKYQRQSMIVVPAGTPGLEFVRDTGVWGDALGEGHHPYLRYSDVRVPKENLLGERGQGFLVAQTRLGGGRIHHAMRSMGLARRAFEMMLERSVSRRASGDELLARKQMVQDMIAETWMELEQFRLFVLQTAWKIDKYNDYKRVRGDISAIKALMPKVLHNAASRALQIHGSLGISNELPFGEWILDSYHMGLADGATEVHKSTLARILIAEATPSETLFPSYILPYRVEESRKRYADALARHGK